MHKITKHFERIIVFLVIPLIVSLLLYYLPSSRYEYVLLGIIGAIFANATGAGGGVVFIPTFTTLGLSDIQAVATSFAIQCFGMTAGSISWLWYLNQMRSTGEQYLNHLQQLIILTLPPTLLASLLTQHLNWQTELNLAELFSYFSIVLGLGLIITLRYQTARVFKLALIDKLILVITAFIGGMLTFWLSVGVGELIAIYLIVRGFDARLAIAAAVIVTAINAWFVSVNLLIEADQVVWGIALSAGPGAILGGILARKIATLISARLLKLMFAYIILFIGLLEFIF